MDDIPAAGMPFGLSTTALVIASIAVLVQVFQKNSAEPPRYTRIDRLFSPAELRFLQVLLLVLPPQVMVFGKVRVADVLAPRKRLSRRQWHRQFWKISSKHFDFVLIDRDTARILCAIELDDRSHLRADRTRRDRFLNAACQSAGFPLLRWPVQGQYNSNDILQRIAETLHPTTE